MIERARFLNRHGYAVLLFDLQGHGESGGDAITFGYLEARDAEAAIRFLREEKGGLWVGVVGTSLGGAAVLLANGAGADAIVVEAVYSPIEEAVDNRFRLRFGSLGKYLSPLLLWQLDWRLGISMRDLTPVDQIGRIRVPVLIIAGGSDRRATVEDTMLLYERRTTRRPSS
jgi:alpha-beta hydrolase superfamily lysophospholipase